MKVLIEKTQNLKKNIILKIDHDIIDNTVKNELLKIAKKIRIDGFRLGKAPIHIIRQRYSTSVRQDVLNDLMPRYFIDAITQEKWHPSSAPTYEIQENTWGKDVIFSVSFDVYPHIELKGLESIEIDKPIINITEADIDAMLSMLRQQKAIWTETHEAAAINNRVTFDFVGSIEHEDFTGNNALNVILILGNGHMLPSFEEGIIGHKADENFMIDVTFPKDYKIIKLQDKNVQFNIILKKVEVCHLPEITAEFIQQFGIKEGSLDALRAEIHTNMQRELKNAVRHFIKLQVINGLVKANNIEIPADIVNSKLDLLKQKITHNNSSTAMVTDSTIPHEVLVEQAKQYMLVGLLFGQIIHSYEIKTNEDHVNALIEEVASAYENKEKVISFYKNNSDLMQNIRNTALEEQAIEAILAQAKLTEKFLTFQEFMYPSFTH
ncbi:Trigger factor [Candidatus Erwinia haradaeae]|uniref:Trigger factor n=1 Tax=Candidatus Erwinia haradaeae TaxID=1922217 RepID=A0A451DD59_9GAMM|nr:trigger factor [Candidatus Erwinia haradaeae]VFP84395.1 Trigger factor [Candidatus Erwinia haradaeae]